MRRVTEMRRSPGFKTRGKGSLIDTVHLGTETIKAQINSTITIKLRKTINIIYCKPCPANEIGHGTCYKITITLQGNTIRRIEIQKPITITITYKITKIEQILSPTCKPAPSPPPPGNWTSPTYITVYRILKSGKRVVRVNGSVEICYPVMKCIGVCKDVECKQILYLKDCRQIGLVCKKES